MNKELELDVFNYFAQICAIPHGSSNMERISQYICDFATEKKLTFIREECGNVIVFKPGTKGYENSKPMILQAHLDMVCVSDNPNRDFINKGIDVIYDGDFIKADGTSLGADNGIGVCLILSILASDNIKHPPIEAVFTVDEEIGLVGASKLDFSKLSAKTMINLDGGTENTFIVSCAGGVTVNCDIDVAASNELSFKHTACVSISGLSGGHSGAEIHLGKANANVICVRLINYLYENNINFRLACIKGGDKENAIATDCSFFVCTQSTSELNLLIELVSKFESSVKSEYKNTDKDLCVSACVCDKELTTLYDLESLFNKLDSVPNGVVAYSKDIENLVETSLNFGIIELVEGKLNLVFSVRSSVEQHKKQIVNQIRSVIESLDGNITLCGEYPCWAYKKSSCIRDTAIYSFKKLFNKNPIVKAIHAGLECGLFYDNISELDCICMGPDEYDIHSPKEKLSISSVNRFYKLLVEVLKNMK